MNNNMKSNNDIVFFLSKLIHFYLFLAAFEVDFLAKFLTGAAIFPFLFGGGLGGLGA